MTNRKRFDQLLYDTDPIRSEAYLEFIQIPVQNVQMEFVIEK